MRKNFYNSKKSVLPLLRRGKTDFFELYGYNVWVLRFSDDNTRFEVNSPILWLITRKTLGSYLSKDSIPMFDVVSDTIRTGHREWELNTEYTHLWPFFVEVTPEIVKVTRGFYFCTKFNQKWIFYEVICHHHQPSRRRSEARWLWFTCWGWTKNRISVISDVKNDDFGKGHWLY